MPKKKTKSRRMGSGAGSGAGTTKSGQADDFSLETQQAPADSVHPARPGKPKAGATGGKKSGQPEVLSYRHSDKRKNNPEVGTVKPENGPDDHHERIDPASILSALRNDRRARPARHSMPTNSPTHISFLSVRYQK